MVTEGEAGGITGAIGHLVPADRTSTRSECFDSDVVDSSITSNVLPLVPTPRLTTKYYLVERVKRQCGVILQNDPDSAGCKLFDIIRGDH